MKERNELIKSRETIQVDLRNISSMFFEESLSNNKITFSFWRERFTTTAPS
jgi:hypothetical protein